MAPSGIRFTRGPSRAKLYYEQLREMWGSLFTDDPEAAINVETFAQAKCLAIASEQLRRAGNQANPRHVTDLIAKLEADYRVVPRPGASIQERRAALAAARAVKGGALVTSITSGLTTILGSLLIDVFPQPMGAVGTGGMCPDTLAPDGGPGAFKPLGETFKAIRFETHNLGASVGYAHVAGETAPLMAGERLTVNPSGTGLIETVTITSATASTFTATFTGTHSAGTLATTASIPYWITGRRLLYIVVADAVFDDAVLLAAAHDYLRKTLGHATCWAVVTVDPLSGGIGPFIIGESLLGRVPMQEMFFTS